MTSFRRSRDTGLLYPVRMGPRRGRVSGALWPANTSISYDYSPLTTSLDINNEASSENVSFPHIAALDNGKADAFSALIWIRGTTNGLSIIFQKGDVSGWQGWWFELTGSGKINVRFYGSQFDDIARTMNGPFTDDNWHLVGFSYDGSNHIDGLLTYANGTYTSDAKSGTTIAGSINTTEALKIGGWPAAGGRYVGQVLHSSVINRVLTPSEWASLFVNSVPQDLDALGLTSDEAHWCTLGDGCAIGAGNCPDLSPEANDGTTLNVESGDFVADVPP